MFKPVYYFDDEYISSLFPLNVRISQFFYGLCINNHIVNEFETYISKKNYYDYILTFQNKIGYSNDLLLMGLAGNPFSSKILRKILEIPNCFDNFYNATDDKFWTCVSGCSNDIEFLEEHLIKLDWFSLSTNHNALSLLEKYPEKIQEVELLANKNAVHLFTDLNINEILKMPNKSTRHLFVAQFYGNINASEFIIKHVEYRIENNDKFHEDELQSLSGNPSLVSFLEKNPHLIYWKTFTMNYNAIHVLEQNQDKINWYLLPLNQNPNIIHLIEKNIDKIDWECLSTNPNAVHLIKNHYKQMRHKMCRLSRNHSDDAIDLIREALEEMGQHGNKSEIKLILQHLGKNPNVLKIVGKLDCQAMKTKCQPFAQELTTYVLNPARLLRICDTYNLDLEEYLDILGD